MDFKSKQGILTFNEDEDITFVTASELPNALGQIMHRKGKIVFAEEDVQVVAIPATDDREVFIKFQDTDNPKILLITNTDNEKGILYTMLMDGANEHSKAHHFTTLKPCNFYLGLQKSLYSIDDQYAIEFAKDDKYTPDAILPYSLAILQEHDIY